MPNVLMYSTEYCPFCVRARNLLDKKGIVYQDIRVDEQPELKIEMIEKSGRRTVPQIFINDKAIGGFDELNALENQGKLDELLRG